MVAIMYAPDDLRIMGVCDGPDATGQCPRCAPGAEVPCWGLDLMISGKEARRLPASMQHERFRVIPGSIVCPLAEAGFHRRYFSPFQPRR